MLRSSIKTEFQYKISYAKNSPGINFDHITDIRTITANWEVAIYLNVLIFLSQYENIKNLKQKTMQLCNQAINILASDCDLLFYAKQTKSNRYLS